MTAPAAAREIDDAAPHAGRRGSRQRHGSTPRIWPPTPRASTAAGLALDEPDDEFFEPLPPSSSLPGRGEFRCST